MEEKHGLAKLERFDTFAERSKEFRSKEFTPAGHSGWMTPHVPPERFFSLDELAEVDSFFREFPESDSSAPARPAFQKAHTLVGLGHGPWGISTENGGVENAWDKIDATRYVVRGPGYLSDQKKVPSRDSLAQLAVVDLFFCETDLAHVSESLAAKTVQRLRREGDERRFVVLNFRLVPLHLVVVFALPDGPDGSSGPARQLLERFAFGGMSNEERKRRLKVIPKVVEGPWAVKKMVGETPTILGRNIPIDFYETKDVLEVSISISTSAAAQRVSKLLMRAGRAIVIELAVLIEGQSQAELPEQVMCGFRVSRADTDSCRTIDTSVQAQRPGFLATSNEVEGY